MQALRFNVAQLLKEPTGATRHYSLDDDISELSEDLQPRAPLKGELVFTRTVDGVLVTGHLTTAAVVTCRRCAVDFVTPVELDLEEEFRAAYDVYTGVRLPRREDDDEAAMIDEQHLLDLSEVMRQDLLLALPVFPLCRPECAGLCPRCGHDLNEGPCACMEAEEDPRWAKLRTFLDNHPT